MYGFLSFVLRGGMGLVMSCVPPPPSHDKGVWEIKGLEVVACAWSLELPPDLQINTVHVLEECGAGLVDVLLFVCMRLIWDSLRASFNSIVFSLVFSPCCVCFLVFWVFWGTLALYALAEASALSDIT